MAKKGKKRTQTTNSTPHPTLEHQFAALLVSENIQNPSSRRGRQARGQFIANEFNNYFGMDTKLENWVMMCSALGLDTCELTSISKCKKAMRGIWVNIWDFLDAVRAGDVPRVFTSQKLLAEYTKATGRFFPKKNAKESGPVKLLLAQVFRY